MKTAEELAAIWQRMTTATDLYQLDLEQRTMRIERMERFMERAGLAPQPQLGPRIQGTEVIGYVLINPDYGYIPDDDDDQPAFFFTRDEAEQLIKAWPSRLDGYDVAAVIPLHLLDGPGAP